MADSSCLLDTYLDVYTKFCADSWITPVKQEIEFL